MRTEHQEQCAIIEWKNWNEHRLPGLECLYAVPNGGLRHPRVAMKLKREGVVSGVPDLVLPVARHGNNALYIELKVGKNKPSEKQLEWIEKLKKHGNLAVVCYGADEAIDVIERYLS